MEFAENRGSGPFKQFKEVYIRNVKFLYRNKSAFIGLIISNVFSALLNISVYWNIGQFPDLEKILIDGGFDEWSTQEAQRKYRRYLTDITGLAFLFANQFTISSSFDAVMQVPLQEPVMKRELASNMYTASAYFLGRYFSHLI